jgi:AbrB family looped-hinge helix DNA binding protein
MQETGIVRRVDDLGRVVIPKEIRRVLGIKEADPLEIFVDSVNKQIVLKHYNHQPDYRAMWERLKRNKNIDQTIVNEIENQFEF